MSATTISAPGNSRPRICSSPGLRRHAAAGCAPESSLPRPIALNANDALVTWLPAGVKLEDLDLSNVPPQYRPQELGLPEALERQLGLKLQPEQAPMPYLAIDSVRRPDPN